MKHTPCLQDGCTPLIKAMEKGLADVATLLVEKGADVNVPTKVRGTWLHVGVC